MEKYPNILTSNEKHEEKVEMLKTVTNIGKENAKSFASNINIFMNFLKEAELEYKMNEKVEKKEEVKESGHILSNKNVVMTKVRDKEIIEKLNEVGGKLVDSINKNTFVLIVKNKEDESNKTKKAKELNIPIMEVDEFKKKYM
jgi:NAD-dependent DNA ligase